MKFKYSVGLILGLGFSVAGFAADDTGTAFTDGAPITANAAGCSLLNEDVRINLSNNVYGAYACNTTSNRIAVATCHPNGMKGTWNVPIMVPDPDWVDPSDGSTAPMIDSGETEEASGGRAYTASSDGGKVIAANSTNCVVTGGSVTAEAAARAGL